MLQGLRVAASLNSGIKTPIHLVIYVCDSSLLMQALFGITPFRKTLIIYKVEKTQIKYNTQKKNQN